MNYHTWRHWLRSKPISFKWLVLIILVRPIINAFWEVRDSVLNVSPLMIVGILVPLLIVFFTLTRQLPPIRYGLTDRYFFAWFAFLLINALLFWNDNKSISVFGLVLKLTMPIYMYFYLRHFITSKEDLHGILTTMLYSLIFPVLALLYEIVFHPFSVIATRGVIRYEGFYADALSYGTYFIGLMFISCYFWLIKDRNSFFGGRKLGLFLFVLGISTVGMLRVNHTTSYGVFIGIILIFFLFLSAQRIRNLIIFPIFLLLSFFIIQQEVEKNFFTLIEGELAVLKGEKDPIYAFHGRMSRWTRHWEKFESHSIPGQFFGLPIDGLSGSGMISNGVHNDFLRLIFFTGYLGLFSYVILLFHLSRKCHRLNSHERFLGYGMIVILLLYSMATTPLLYEFVNNLSMSIFAFVASPRSIWRENQNLEFSS